MDAEEISNLCKSLTLSEEGPADGRSQNGSARWGKSHQKAGDVAPSKNPIKNQSLMVDGVSPAALIGDNSGEAISRKVQGARQKLQAENLLARSSDIEVTSKVGSKSVTSAGTEFIYYGLGIPCLKQAVAEDVSIDMQSPLARKDPSNGDEANKSRREFESVCVILWQLWFDRNCFVHKGELKEVVAILSSAAILLNEFQNTLAACSVQQEVPNPLPSSLEVLSWIPPPLGSLKLNFDASLKEDSTCSFLGLGLPSVIAWRRWWLLSLNASQVHFLSK
ncbi:hypothetical protein ACOSQ2_014826 [Xanthoceras sorbifolium]